jgi:hypothetical protein
MRCKEKHIREFLMAVVGAGVVVEGVLALKDTGLNM